MSRPLLTALLVCYPCFAVSRILRGASPGFPGTETSVVQPGESSGAACGVTLAAFGDLEGKYVKAALANVLRLQAMKPSAGWCPLDKELAHVPITLFTDLPADRLSEELGQGADSSVSIVSNNTFDTLSVDADRLPSGWWNEGHPKYRWYHCQALVHAPHDLTLYLDSDATICTMDRFVNLFNKFATSDADMAFEWNNDADIIFGEEISKKGWYCTDHDNTNPHPDEVQTEDDLQSWQKTMEPNAGVILYARKRPAARKVAAGWCAILEESMRSGAVGARPCDQYALRASFWRHRQEFTPMALTDGIGSVCRYSKNINLANNTMTRTGCSDGCALVHGWEYPEVQALVGE